ncbi:MAG TPA: DUF167 family protein [Bdellovibrionota bacterium]|jgi:uncharacterized protein (TIGR00251 family)|nr:DUF167 family protein [Bdellovibrionota bacterium]
MPPPYLSPTAEGVILRLHIQPKASRTEIVGVHGTGADARLKVRIAAPPVDGAANEELVRFLKKALGASGAELVRGHSSRSKDLLIRGLSAHELADAIAKLQK